jgi:transcriptional regulator with XRE-family HTH domain
MTPRTVDDLVREELRDPQFMQEYAEAKEAWSLAIQLARLRRERGLTQAQVAEMAGTKQQNVARIENPDYSGHSLNLLRRIARAFGMVVRVAFVPPRVVVQEELGLANRELAHLWHGSDPMAETAAWSHLCDSYTKHFDYCRSHAAASSRQSGLMFDLASVLLSASGYAEAKNDDPEEQMMEKLDRIDTGAYVRGSSQSPPISASANLKGEYEYEEKQIY